MLGQSFSESGLISFRIDWFDLLAVQGTLKSLLQCYSLKTSNRFKELDLVDRVPEELWTEVRDFVQEVVIKTILKKKKCKKAKWLSEKALQIAEKRQEAKGKGERERSIYLNAEFQRIPRRNKKVINAKK